MGRTQLNLLLPIYSHTVKLLSIKFFVCAYFLYRRECWIGHRFVILWGQGFLCTPLILFLGSPTVLESLIVGRIQYRILFREVNGFSLKSRRVIANWSYRNLDHVFKRHPVNRPESGTGLKGMRLGKSPSIGEILFGR